MQPPNQKKVLFVLPSKDFDVTETAVPWHTLTRAGVAVHFTTSDGKPGQCDPLLLGSVVFGMFGASGEAKKNYAEMEKCAEFRNPVRYEEVDFMQYDGVILPGGHAQGMKPYLEDTTIRVKLPPFINDKSKTVAAICHGVLVLARTTDPSTGKSLLWPRRSACLPKYMERSAYYLSAWKHGRYYRTYEEYVEDEVKAHMKESSQYEPGTCNWFGSLDGKYASICIDGNYISARWPGDAKLFAEAILKRLNGS